MKSIRFAAIFATAMFVVRANAGEVTYGNMPQINDDGISADLTGLRRKAMAFATGGEGYYLALMQGRFMLSSSTSFPVVGLYSSIAGGPTGQMPGVLIGELGIQLTISAGIHTVSFPSFSPLLLELGTTYWIVVGGGSETYDWRGSDPPITPTGFATHSGSLSSADGGASWASDGVLNSLALVADPVPEPVTFGTLGLLTLGLFLRRKPRR